MRTKIILPVFILVCAIGAALLWPKFFHAENPAIPLALETAVVKINSQKKFPMGSADQSPAPTNIVSATNAPPATPQPTVDELQSLAMNNDADSLKTILSELTNADPEIRAAARAAAVQFGDKSAAPALRAASAQVESPQEKVEFLDAADFLELPHSEVRSPASPPRNNFTAPVQSQPPLPTPN